jgi:hypothetical protein
MFGPKREEAGSWRKLHNAELLGLYLSPCVVRVIKSRRSMRWAGHVAHIGRGEVFTGFWLGGPKGGEWNVMNYTYPVRVKLFIRINIILDHYLLLALGEDEWSTSCPCQFYYQ